VSAAPARAETRFAEAERPPARRPARIRRRRGRPNLVAGLLAAVWLVIVVVPLLAIVADSLKQQGSYLSHGPLAPPASVSGSNFTSALSGGFGGYALNTAIVTAASVLLTLALGIPAAYAIVRSRHRFVSGVFRMFLAGLAIPVQAVIIPVYLYITRLHFYDSLIGIILPTVAFALPLSILVLAANLRNVPRELSEAMTLDGGGAFRLLWSLALPLSKAGITTVVIYTALQAWNGFLFPLILTQSPSVRVLTLGLYQYQSQFGINVPGLMAAVLLSGLPLFVLYLCARRWLIAGFVSLGNR
jgi:xylobiose transport system permease protein